MVIMIITLFIVFFILLHLVLRITGKNVLLMFYQLLSKTCVASTGLIPMDTLNSVSVRTATLIAIRGAYDP